MKRFMAILGITAMLGSSIALAHECFVANKPQGAGSAGTATLDLASGSFDPSGIELNPAGKAKGAFVTLTVTYEGTPVASEDVFWHKTLPDGALNSGPGDDYCDGVGVDAASACQP